MTIDELFILADDALDQLFFLVRILESRQRRLLCVFIFNQGKKEKTGEYLKSILDYFIRYALFFLN